MPNVLQYLTSKETGCCTVGELMTLSKSEPNAVQTLKEYAREEMKNRGIEITEK